MIVSLTGVPCFIALQCIVDCREYIFTMYWKVYGNSASTKSLHPTFPTIFAYFASLSHFGHSHNISDFFIIVICNQ